jgi:glycosyltransferase involved in cell wall biosynthesis
MNVLIVSNLYPPVERGGAEKIAYRVANELFLRGHVVTVLATKRFDGFASLSAHVTETDLEPIERFFPLNIYHTLDDRHFPMPVRALWHMIDAWSPHPYRVLKDVIARRAPDVVLTHNLKGLGLQACRAIREARVPQLHTLHDVQLSVPSGLLISGKENSFENIPPLRRAYEFATKGAVGSPDVIVSPSRFLASFYQDRGFFPKSRIEIVPNPAPPMQVPPRGERLPGPLRLLYVGQLERHKGVAFLLHALERLEIPFELHVAGEGRLADAVKNWARADARVTCHGYISLPHLTQLLAICDATLVPSLCYENSPNAIYESLAAGVPVIASRIGGVGELVKDGVNGMLLPAGDLEAWRVGLRQFAATMGDFRARSDETRKEAEAYALPNYVTKLEGLMQDIRRR